MTGLAVTWVVLLTLVVSSPRGQSAGFSSGTTAWVYFLNQPQVIWKYLALSLWPRGLVLDYGLPQSVSIGIGSYAVPLAAAFAATLLAWCKRPWHSQAFLGTWLFATLAPASSFIPVTTEVGAERRMYLPLIAVAVLFACAVAHALAGLAPSRRRQVASVATALTCCGLGFLTFQRNRDT
jgi:hypothetical protein